MNTKESFHQISPSEFFYRNRDLAGFSNPTRSLYTAVRELVENSLDACDQYRILPNIHLIINPITPQQSDPQQYDLTVHDNGPGMESKQIPFAFGTVLYGSKFGFKQARGMFGLGATMAILYGQITTNKPVHIKSSIDGKIQHEYDILLDIQKNKPLILKHTTSSASHTGLSITISLDGDYSKAGLKIRDYVYQTSLITPYATIFFDDPKGNKYEYKRIIKKIPSAPTIIKPHPYGVDVETIRRMISNEKTYIPKIHKNIIIKIKKELGCNINDTDHTIKIIKKRWPRLSKQTKTMLSIASCLNYNFNKLIKIRIDEIDIINNKLHYWDYDELKSYSTEIPNEYSSQLINMINDDTLSSFLTKNFQRIGSNTAHKFSKFANFKPEKKIAMMNNQELVQLSDSLQKFTDFLSPDPSCLAPLGSDLLEKGINKFFSPDFLITIQRKASAYSGFPFIVEIGIAYGGSILNGMKIYRFANRIPLLYDEGSDVVFKVINSIDWNRYKVKNDSPIIIATHICSTRIPYKTVGKENVADRQEIERELKLSIQFLARKVSSYLSKKGKAEMAKKRANLYSTYMPLIARFCTELAGKKNPPHYKKILEGY